MLDFIELVPKFILRHLMALKFIKYLIFTFLGLLIAIIALLYQSTGRIILNPATLFSVDTYQIIINTYRKEIYIFFILEQITFMFILLWQNYKIKKRMHCSVKTIHIEDIANIWLQNEKIRENIRKEVTQEILRHNTVQKVPEIINFTKNRSKEFYESIIVPYIHNISNDELSIIVRLLNFLEEYGDIQSVVSYTSNDSNNAYKKEIVTSDNKTSFEILQTISLYNHSINTAEEIYKIVKEEDSKNYPLIIGKAIIAALAHDIGKIKKAEEKVKKISVELFSKQPHHKISSIMFNEMFSDYKLKDTIIEAIENHHAVKVPKDNKFIKLLINADKRARKREIDQYIKTHYSNQNKKIIITKESDEKETPKNQITPTKKDIEKEMDSLTDDWKNYKKDNNQEQLEDKKEHSYTQKDNENKKENADDKENYENVSNETVFDLNQYENKILENLKAQINKSKNKGYRNIICSISYKDMILFSFETIKNAIKDSIGYDIDNEELEKITKYFIDEYRKRKNIGYIGKNYYTSKFFIKDKKMEEYNCVPMFAKVFNLTEDDLKKTKLENQNLKNLKVFSYQEKNE